MASVVFPDALAPTMTMDASAMNLCIRSPGLSGCESVSEDTLLGLAEVSERHLVFRSARWLDCGKGCSLPAMEANDRLTFVMMFGERVVGTGVARSKYSSPVRLLSP